LTGAGLASPGAGTSPVLICLDHADEEIDQHILLGGSQWREYAGLSGYHLGTKSAADTLSFSSQVEFTRTSVGAVDPAFNQAFAFQLINEMTDVRTIESHQHGQTALVDTGEVLKNRKRRELRRGFGSFTAQHVRNRPCKYLFEPPHQRIRDMMWYNAALD
jgi:hypothetical protein